MFSFEGSLLNGEAGSLFRLWQLENEEMDVFDSNIASRPLMLVRQSSPKGSELYSQLLQVKNER